MRIKLFPERHIPRLIIFAADIAVCCFSLFIAYLLRFNFQLPAYEIASFKYVFPLVIVVRASTFYLFKTYAGIIRYTSTRDATRILTALAVGGAFIALINPIGYLLREKFLVPYSILIIDYLLSVFVMTAGRLLVKVAYMEMRNPRSERTGVVIYGAGEAGMITKRTLDRDRGSRLKVIAFVDDDKNKTGKKLEGVMIYNAHSDLEDILRVFDVKHLIISIQNIHPKRKQEIIEACLKFNTKVLNVPPIKTWINGELSFKQIKKVNIDDLLSRDPIQLDLSLIKSTVRGKTIMITGAAGSIGSEIVRQLIPFEPLKLVLVDMAESPLYELELDIDETADFMVDCETVIGDVRNMERMRHVYETFKPQIVFHAAAYKHVPVMENNPSESILNNVMGTKIMADLAHETGVGKFVMISTDKAVNPTNIMGATKRIAEIYIQSLDKVSRTQFITTRFGNVLGSNGSVIPRFKKQIDAGLPITVTHPEITRFFMTISEACQLVLEAASMGNGGEIYIFDMGQSVRIADLAKRMVQLSGLEMGKDTQIIYTGLRPGEKLYEELLCSEENTIATHHKKIMIAKVKTYDFETISQEVRELIGLFGTQDNDSIVRRMKEIVPEYISNNSVYEKLDR
ncbi:MAG: nucleoside-diphosphate sugar epimerase/dehydratase [Bacteroidota bacterium]